VEVIIDLTADPYEAPEVFALQQGAALPLGLEQVAKVRYIVLQAVSAFFLLRFRADTCLPRVSLTIVRRLLPRPRHHP
jgi:hypothetical protein